MDGSVLVRPLANPVARRVVVADPDFATVLASHGASYFPCATPDYLRVVSAHAAADIGTIVILTRLRNPIAYYLGWGGMSARNLKNVFTEVGIGAMVEPVLSHQLASPVLSAGC